MKQSKRFSLNWKDIDVWGKNTVIFAAPAFLVFLTSLQTGGTFQEAIMALKVWLLNVCIDLLRKFISNK